MSDRSERLTRRQQRLSEKTARKEKPTKSASVSNLQLKPISPLTNNQIHAFNAFDDRKHVCLLGSAGTGKSFISLYHAFKDVFDKETPYRKVIIVRTPQPSKQIGFLPGTDKEKIAVYEEVYKSLFAQLFGRGDAYEVCKQKGLVEFTGTSFLRGVTFDDAVVVVDEIQAMSLMEVATVQTRIGSNSKIFMCGDTAQDDLTSKRYNERSGIGAVIKILKLMPSVEMIFFGLDDIVRSGYVREWLIAYETSGVDSEEYR